MLRFKKCIVFTVFLFDFVVQNAPLSEQQQAAILALSHAVAERPYPANLVSQMPYYLELGFEDFASKSIALFSLAGPRSYLQAG